MQGVQNGQEKGDLVVLFAQLQTKSVRGATILRLFGVSVFVCTVAYTSGECYIEAMPTHGVSVTAEGERP